MTCSTLRRRSYEVKELNGRYIETITDEDRLDAYKLMTVRVELPESTIVAPAP